ncbi:hypothetical protein LTA6_003368 [Microbacterium sp. LTA6]|uniref:hypothetical protein n=1 Tax=unclassified Microbacterium TaxID=2609290 RepID=UPI0031399CA2
MVRGPVRSRVGDSADDPSRVRNQPALRTSSGAIWLIVGAVFTAICLIPLVGIVATGRSAGMVAIATIVLMVALYAAMVTVRLAASPGPQRLQRMAFCFLSMAAVTLVGMIACVLLQWGAPGSL